MSTSTVTNRAQILKEKFRLCLGLPLRELLPESRIEQVVKELGFKYRNRLFNPVVTVWTFLLQVLDVDKSCHNAVSRVVAWLSSEKVEIPSEEFSALPKTQKIREIFYSIEQPGFRTQSVSLLTTLLDIDAFTPTALTQLYRSRWDVELDLKHLKTSLGMDILRSKTPDGVRKEIYAFLLAYNLLRNLMCEAGTTYSSPPLRLSLQGTRHLLYNFIPQFLSVCAPRRSQIYLTLLKVIVHKLVPHRPGRVEPRVTKRRPKAYPSMPQPRSLLRQQLLAT